MKKPFALALLLVVLASLLSACPVKRMDRDDDSGRHERSERSGSSRY